MANYSAYGPNRRNGSYVVKTPDSELLGGNLTAEEAAMIVDVLNGKGSVDQLTGWLGSSRGKSEGRGIERHLMEKGARAAVDEIAREKMH